MRYFPLAAGLAVCSVLLVAGCGDGQRFGADAGNTPPTGTTPTYDATIRRDSVGVPHIRGEDYGDIGYGYGYAHAEDNVCVLAEDLICLLYTSPSPRD